MIPTDIRDPARHPHLARLMIWRSRLREPLLTVLLAIQVFSLFMVPMLRAMGVLVPHIASISVFLVFVGLATVLSRSLGAMLTLMVSVLLTLAGLIWRSENPDFVTDTISTVGQVLTQLSLLWVLATAVFGPGQTTPHRILGAIVMYLGIGAVFTSLDLLLARTVADAFTHLPANSVDLREALTYYSYGTLTTGNFGDITPVNPIARSLANLESICGQLFPATLLARLVAAQSGPQRAEP